MKGQVTKQQPSKKEQKFLSEFDKVQSCRGKKPSVRATLLVWYCHGIVATGNGIRDIFVLEYNCDGLSSSWNKIVRLPGA